MRKKEGRKPTRKNASKAVAYSCLTGERERGGEGREGGGKDKDEFEEEFLNILPLLERRSRRGGKKTEEKQMSGPTFIVVPNSSRLSIARLGIPYILLIICTLEN